MDDFRLALRFAVDRSGFLGQCGSDAGKGFGFWLAPLVLTYSSDTAGLTRRLLRRVTALLITPGVLGVRAEPL